MLIHAQAAGLAERIGEHYSRLRLEIIAFCWSNGGWIPSTVSDPSGTAELTQDDDESNYDIPIPGTEEEIRACYRGIQFFADGENEPNLPDDNSHLSAAHTLMKAVRQIALGLDVARRASLDALVTECEHWMESTFLTVPISARYACDQLKKWSENWTTISRFLLAVQTSDTPGLDPPSSGAVVLDLKVISLGSIRTACRNLPRPWKGNRKMEHLLDNHRDAALELDQPDWAIVLGVSTRTVRKYNGWKRIRDLRETLRKELERNRAG